MPCRTCRNAHVSVLPRHYADRPGLERACLPCTAQKQNVGRAVQPVQRKSLGDSNQAAVPGASKDLQVPSNLRAKSNLSATGHLLDWLVYLHADHELPGRKSPAAGLHSRLISDGRLRRANGIILDADLVQHAKTSRYSGPTLRQRVSS